MAAEKSGFAEHDDGATTRCGHVSYLQVRARPSVGPASIATANPTQVIVAQKELGRGVLGVVDGASPLGVETDADIAWRKDLLRQLGYKL